MRDALFLAGAGASIVGSTGYLAGCAYRYLAGTMDWAEFGPILAGVGIVLFLVPLAFGGIVASKRLGRTTFTFEGDTLRYVDAVPLSRCERVWRAHELARVQVKWMYPERGRPRPKGFLFHRRDGHQDRAELWETADDEQIWMYHLLAQWLGRYTDEPQYFDDPMDRFTFEGDIDDSFKRRFR